MSQNNREGLLSYLKKNGKTENESWDTLSKKFGFSSADATRSYYKRNQNKKLLKDTSHNDIFSPKRPDLSSTDYESKINNEKGISSVKWISTKETLTEVEIYKECKMDPVKWVMTQIWHKKRSGGWIYSADFKLKPSNHIDNTTQRIDSLLKNYKTSYIPLTKENIIQNNKYTEPVALYISLTDAHLDRLTTHGRNIKDAVNQYLETIEYLVMKSFCCNFVDEIVYVIGNDLFNSDTYFTETTAGTQQHDNVMYDESYERIFDMQVKAINKLKQFCNKLHVKFVPGNHDRTKGFYLVHALDVYFHSDKNIIFDREATNTKVYTYGNNFIGMHHGDTKPENLPLYFAKKYSKEWGGSKFQEIAIGDKHVKRSWEQKIKPTEDEFAGVRVFMTPSLTDNSLWEKDGLMDVGISAGICRWYAKNTGKCGEIEHRIFLKD